MSDSFRILAGFLDRFGEEAEGRAVQEPPEEYRRKLRCFARGELSAGEMNGAFEILSKNPEWVAWFAVEVKSLRPGNQTT